MTAHRDPVLLGRAAERRALDRLLRTSAISRSAVWSCAARPGVGKTALLRPLRPAGVGLPHRAGSPASSRRWSCRSRGCISCARRCSTGSTPCRSRSRRRCGVALGLAPAPRPTASWSRSRRSACSPRSRPSARCCASSTTRSGSTRASAQVLGFVARRLLAESVALVFAVRDPSDDARARGPAASSTLGGAARRGRPRAARHRHPGPARRARPRPARGRDSRQPARDAGAAAGAGRRRSCRRRSGCRARTRCRADRGELPAAARGAAGRDAAAAAGRGGGADRRPAADVAARPSGSGSPATALERRGPGRLIDVGAQVRFRHPLVRSAVYRSASAERAPGRAPRAGRGHRRERSTPDRRAWHRAAGHAGPDEDVAAELERSAGRAQARGGLAAAAAFLGRAAALTLDPGPARRPGAGGRAGAACRPARSTPRSGCSRPRRPARSTSSGAPASSCCTPSSPTPRTGAATLRCCCCGRRGTLERLDVRLSRDTYLDAWSAALFAGRLAGDGDLHDVSRAVRRAPGPGPRRVRATSCSTASRSCSPTGRPAAAPVLRARPPRSPAPRSRSRRCSAGAGWRRPPPCSSGTTTPAWRSPPAQVAARPRRGRAGGARRRRQRAGPGRRAERRLRGGVASGRGGRRGHRGHRHAHRAVRRARARGAARPRGGGLGADRGHDRRRPPPAARAPPSSTRTGRGRC